MSAPPNPTTALRQAHLQHLQWWQDRIRLRQTAQLLPWFCPGCGIDLHENLSTRLQTVSLNDVRLHCDCGCVLVKVASALRPPLSVPKLPRRRPLRRKAGF